MMMSRREWRMYEKIYINILLRMMRTAETFHINKVCYFHHQQKNREEENFEKCSFREDEVVDDDDNNSFSHHSAYHIYLYFRFIQPIRLQIFH